MAGFLPTRGPTAKGAIFGLLSTLLGVVLLALVWAAGAPALLGWIGLALLVISIAGVIYDAYNASAKERYRRFEEE